MVLKIGKYRNSFQRFGFSKESVRAVCGDELELKQLRIYLDSDIKQRR